MKTQLLQAAILFTMLSCDFGRDRPPKEFLSVGTFEADFNGKKWTETYKNAYYTIRAIHIPESVECSSNHIGINFRLFSTNGRLRQELTLSKIPYGTGRHFIIPSRYYDCEEDDPVYGTFFPMDDDVINGFYDPLNAAHNYVEIYEYNSKTQEIKGRFQITFVRKKRGEVPVLPDTIRITNGLFHTRINKVE